MRCKLKNSKKVKMEIAALGFNQAGFAKKIGVSNAFTNQVLNDKRTCTPKTAIKFSTGLNKNIDDIFIFLSSDNHTKKERGEIVQKIK